MTQINYTIPIAGVTLNSIADPEIATALQTIQSWANGQIDTGNLSPTAAIKGTQIAANAAIAGSQLASNAGILGSQLSASAGITVGQLAAGALSWLTFTSAGTSVNAVSGQFIKATAAPITVTLPAPAANALVGVEAGTSATGASPVTVATNGGVIYGTGVNGALSIPLGVVGASVILQCDGTNWYVIAGRQDTGWVALTPATGWSTSVPSFQSGSFYSPAGRLVGDTVVLRGAQNNQTGGVVTSGSIVATMPASLRPTNAVAFVPTLYGATSPGQFGMTAEVIANGSLYAFNMTTTMNVGCYIVFDGCNYSIS